ncbi:NAD-dependent epimerase/dehydratase family protein [Thioclava kandeliae]|uniref:NAD(P)-dependent oxidoreductase n=1 Tax=Thioclava kandeliae TaxID=3070818 RepID=A0ABV1SLZ6_9RHOB
MKTIAITGGCGFVGLALAESLLARGHVPHLLDLAPTPLAAHPSLCGAVYHRCDVTCPGEIEAALAHNRPDIVVHTAALTPSPQMEREQAARVIEVNLTGTSNMLQAVQASGIRRLIYLSSAAIYGSSPRAGATLPEDAELRPNSLYGVTKEASERLAAMIAQGNDIKVSILRLGPVFGPWEMQGSSRPGLSAQGQMLALHKAGKVPLLPSEMVTDWVYSRDVGAAIAALIEAPPPEGSEIFNLGAGHVSSPLDWAAGMGFKGEVVSPEAATITARVSDGRSPLDISRLAARIGYAGARGLEAACRDHQRWLAEVAAL